MSNLLTSLAKRVARTWPSVVLARRLGARFLLHPQNWIDNRILVGAPFEREQIRSAQRAVVEQQLDLVVDIGANIGFYTVLLGRMPQVKTVVAFEPVRRNYAQLMGNVFVNGLSDKVDAHRLALGQSAGQAVIHVDPYSTGVSRLDLGTTARPAKAFAQRETIEIGVFDQVCKFQDRRAFVKIDVEGSAVEVLSGMSRFLSANYAVIQVELSDAERSGVVRILANAGYGIAREFQGDVIFVRDVGSAQPQLMPVE